MYCSPAVQLHIKSRIAAEWSTSETFRVALSNIIQEANMEAHRTRSALRVVVTLILAIASVGCSVSQSSDYELRSGQTVSGSLFIPSGNVTLDQGSRVQGSLYMLCCNLIVRGEVDGSVVMLSGNIAIDPQATVRGKVTDYAGNIQQSAPAGTDSQP